MAVKKKTAMVKWDEKLAELAGRATKAVSNVGGGNIIGTKGGILTYKGAAMPDNEMNVVVLCDIPHNTYYPGGFDPDTPSAPSCYAFADPDNPEAPMSPHPDVAKPESDECTGCPQNEWGSADRGRGKACGNKHRLALITEGDLEDVVNAETAFLHVPPTSVKGWAGMVRKLEQTLNKPPLAFVITISAEPSERGGFKLIFSNPREIEDGEVLGALIDKSEFVKKEIVFPYTQIENAAPARRVQGGGRGGGKTVAVAARGGAAARSSKLAGVTTPAARKAKFTR